MNGRERMLAVWNGDTPDRIPRYVGFTPDLRRRVAESIGTDDIDDYFDMDRLARVALKPPKGYKPPDFSGCFADENLPEQTEVDPNGVARVPGDFYHFTHIVSPLRNAASLDEIEAHPIETEDTFDSAHMKQQVETARRQGRAVRGGVGHIYENAWQIRGHEQFLMDMHTNPEWAESILDRLTQRAMNRAVAAAEAGADCLHTADDVASQRAMIMSPQMWRKLLKPRWAKVYDAARAIKPDIHFHYHSDGDISPIIPELIEIGVTILNPVQPECLDPAKVKHDFGDRLALDGTIGTQTTFPFAKPQEMKQLVRQRIETLGPTRLILSPTHVLEPDVPIENIIAFFEACDEFGRVG